MVGPGSPSNPPVPFTLLSLLVLPLGVPSLSHFAQPPSTSTWLLLTTEDLIQNCLSFLYHL